MACSNFWKLDKIDKIVISIVFIIVSLISFAQCFAVENVDILIIDGLGIESSTGLITSSGSSVGYFNIEPGYIYHITNGLVNSPKVYGFSNSIIELSDYVFDVSTLPGRDSVDITYSQYQYLYFNIYGGSAVTVTREKLPGLEGSVDLLVSNVGPGALWGIFEISLPYVLVVIILALGFYFIRRMAKWISRGKGGI